MVSRDAGLIMGAMDQRHDVVIVGGGLVGASLAIALDGSGLDVGLVESAPAGRAPPVFDQRNLSFAAATVQALTTLGVMRHLAAPAGPIRRIHVSRQGDFGRVLLQASDHGREAFGQVVVASDFGRALESRLGELPRLTRYRPARFLGLADAGQGDDRSMRLHTDAGEVSLQARLLVGADGTHSSVRTALGIGADEHDFQQTLLVARMRAAQAPDGTAYERFGPDGPTALLPRGDRHFGVVHGVPREQADAVATLDDHQWLARVQGAFGWRVGRFAATGERSAYPIVQVVARRTTAPRAVLLGNAAQTLHPIGAQGFNLGLRDALLLAELLANAGDPADPSLLQAHASRRAADRERALAFSSGLARLTANDTPLAAGLRSLGLMAAAASLALQSSLVGGAMGFGEDVPVLCREPIV